MNKNILMVLAIELLRGWGPISNSKIAISRKISPLTYPEKSLLFPKWTREAFWNGFRYKILIPDCLPENQWWTKKFTIYQILLLFVKIKTSHEKKFLGKSFHFSQECRYKKKILNQTKNILAWTSWPVFH